jgi:fluoroacetyl-CoA thioesterase
MIHNYNIYCRTCIIFKAIIASHSGDKDTTMKDTLRAGLEKKSKIDVDEKRTIAFLGDDSRVYATPFLLYDIEVVSRELITEHLDGNEDSVGAHVDLTHMAPTPLGMWAEIKVNITAVEGRKVDLSFECNDAMGAIAKGSHSRFIVDKEKTVQHIKSKMQNTEGGANG